MRLDYVILVDEQDNELGIMEKLKAHEEGKLHRAFSVFLFNDKNELLLQKRATSKYHSGGLWTNTCCSHPRPHETIKDAAARRLFEEMGITCDLRIKTNFIYQTPFSNGLVEHELDYVLTGKTNQNPQINLQEVETFKWQCVADIKQEMLLHPHLFSSWFQIAVSKFF
jgi:isopentenyl-diphosphate Delta-isomerase